MLRIVGMWGNGKHAKIWVQDADVLDLSISVDHAPREPAGNRHLMQRQFVGSITEDVDPIEGQDVPFGDQVLQAPKTKGDSWTVAELEDIEPLELGDGDIGHAPAAPGSHGDGDAVAVNDAS